MPNGHKNRVRFPCFEERISSFPDLNKMGDIEAGMFHTGILFVKFGLSRAKLVFPASILPWTAQKSIRIPRERQSLAMQLDKLSSIIMGPELDGRKAVALQNKAKAAIDTSLFALDTLLEEIGSTGTLTPKMMAWSQPAASPQAQLPAAEPRDQRAPAPRRANLQQAA